MTATASLINQTIGNYRVSKLLGEGGMGVVYLAQHPVIGRKVAIKLLHAALARDQDIVSRFFNEARAIHMIAHENIVEILDFGQTTDGQPYFIMEFLEGEALSDAVARGPMPPERSRSSAARCAGRWARRTPRGSSTAISSRTTCSWSPSRTGRLHVKILDFGVAKILASPDGAQSVKTRTGSLMGTPLYMSPEQCKGAGTLDHRTDIYSLGVMLFEMLAGRPPFIAEGRRRAVRQAHARGAAAAARVRAARPAAHGGGGHEGARQGAARPLQSMDEFRKALVGEVKLAGAPARRAMRRPIVGR